MTETRSNGYVADLLERHGRLLEVAGESPFRTRAFTRAADTIRVLPETLSTLAAEGRLREIPGVGEAIAAKIEETLDRGSFTAHDELTSQFPETLLELVAIPGVGTKTAMKLHAALGVDSIDSLEAAVLAGKVADAKGLGPRAESTIRSGIEAIRRRTGRTPIGSALPLARAFESAYAAARPQDRISLAGSARRWEVTVGDLDFAVATTDPDSSVGAATALPQVERFERLGDTSIRLVLAGGVNADLYCVDPGSWGTMLVRATGNAAHLERLGQIPGGAITEQEVYASKGLPWIPPELRTGGDEFERWQEIPNLVGFADVNGEFHAHTTWSDGAGSILDMAVAAAACGYQFLGITDHSHGLGVANGLDVARLEQQRADITLVNTAAEVTLLAGAEVEVHRGGELDFDDPTLGRMDVVVASLHSGLRQPKNELTDRLIRVLENRNVDIIAHPSGRLIERREGGDFDWARAFDTAARTGTALEINADPARLDLDPHLARQAHDAGCLITINCDAHHPSGFAVMSYGVAMARRAWLKPDDILNCWDRDRVLEWLTNRNRPAGSSDWL